MASRLLARLVRQGGTRLIDLAVRRILPEAPVVPPPAAPAPPPKKVPLPRKLAGLALTRVATRSVPGAIIVGGAFLAKKLYDRRHAGQAGSTRGKRS